MALTVRFAGYRLDGDERRLTRDGQDVHLTPKAFDLLCVLVAEAPRVVPKAELHEKLWPRTFVSEATLTGLVKEVRRAIDDSGSSHVRTVHGVGYAFAADAPDERSLLPSGQHWLLVSGRSIMLVAGENLIGRDTAAAVCLDYAGVSRRHARVMLDAHGATIEDLGSKNGTRVGEQVVTGAVRLENGDSIRVGPALLVYRVSSDPLSTETQLSTELD